jgi:hypothetical protein
MSHKRGFHGPQRSDLFRRVCKCCTTVVIVAGLISATAAVAQNVPRLGPLTTLELSTRNHRGHAVFNMRVALKRPDTGGSFDATGTVRFSPQLCEAKYRLHFVYTPLRGDAKTILYPARMRRGRLDGTRQRCPFAGLPDRGMKSMDVRAIINRKYLLHFDAKPSTRSGNPFARLKHRLHYGRPNTETGTVRVRVRVHYRSHRSHTVQFIAKTDI